MCHRLVLITKKSGDVFRVGIFLDFVWLTTRTEGPHGAYMGRTCGESDEIELTAIGVELNGSRRVGWVGWALREQREGVIIVAGLR